MMTQVDLQSYFPFTSLTRDKSETWTQKLIPVRHTRAEIHAEISSSVYVLACAFCRRSQHLKNLAKDARCQEFPLPRSDGLHLEAKRTHDADSAQLKHTRYCAVTSDPRHVAWTSKPNSTTTPRRNMYSATERACPPSSCVPAFSGQSWNRWSCQVSKALP